MCIDEDGLDVYSLSTGASSGQLGAGVRFEFELRYQKWGLGISRVY